MIYVTVTEEDRKRSDELRYSEALFVLGERCPIALALCRTLGIPYGAVDISGGHIRFKEVRGYPGYRLPLSGIELPIPPDVRDQVTLFDTGEKMNLPFEFMIPLPA